MDKNKKIAIVGLIAIVIISIIGTHVAFDLTEKIVNMNTTTTNNTTQLRYASDDENVSVSNSNSASDSHNGMKYKDGIWYDPNDPSTWYDANGNWQKMEPDITKDFAYSHSGPNDKYYNSRGEEVSKDEYFNDPNIKWG